MPPAYSNSQWEYTHNSTKKTHEGNWWINEKTNICLVVWSLLIFVESEASDST